MKIQTTRPCPFCGSVNITVSTRYSRCGYGDKRYLAQATCSKCGARGPVAKTDKMDIRSYYDDRALRDDAVAIYEGRQVRRRDDATPELFAEVPR